VGVFARARNYVAAHRHEPAHKQHPVVQQWGGQGGRSPGAPSAGAHEFQAKNNNCLIRPTVKIRTYGYQTLECFIATPPS